MKYIIRRAVLGAVAVPFIAGAYTLGYAGLVGLGGQPTATVSEVWSNGLMFGIVVAVALTFAPQLMRTVERVLEQ